MCALAFTRSAWAELARLKRIPRHAGLVKPIKRTLGFLQTTPRYPSLQTHVFHSLGHPDDPRQKVFEAYVPLHTPAAHRLFWCDGPTKDQVTIIAITPPP